MAVISHATTMTNEARRAAEATKQETDPDQYAEYAVEVIDEHLEERMKDIRQTANDLLKASSYTSDVLSKADQDRTDSRRQLLEQAQKLGRSKSRFPWVSLAAVFLALSPGVTLPRFMASKGPIRAVLGVTWAETSTGVAACVFHG